LTVSHDGWNEQVRFDTQGYLSGFYFSRLAAGNLACQFDKIDRLELF